MSAFSVIVALLLSSLFTFRQSCKHWEGSHEFASFNPADTIAANHAALKPSTAIHRKIALDNVRAFDGKCFLPPSPVVIEGALFGIDAANAEHIYGGARFAIYPAAALKSPHALLPSFATMCLIFSPSKSRIT